MNELVREAQTWMELSERGRAHRRERQQLVAAAMPNGMGAATRLKAGSSSNGRGSGEEVGLRWRLRTQSPPTR